MALKFNLKDFFSPFNILKLQNEFSRNQFLNKSEIDQLQLEKLKTILNFAKNNVPYYARQPEFLNLDITRINSLSDLAYLPSLTKHVVKNNLDYLIANNVNPRHLSKVSTSGSSGEPLVLYMDKYANVLEFCFYRRFWGWHGYKLFDRFADLSSYTFKNTKLNYIFNRYYNRLILNTSVLSPEKVKTHIELLEKFSPKFLKGSPTTIYNFINLAKKNKNFKLNLKAIFTSGEVLRDHIRLEIEDFFGTRVFDAYGHMERTFAACECSYQKLHLNLDYGCTEIIDFDQKNKLYKLISTGLYNKAMPLIRYEANDLIEYCPEQTCNCACNFPIIQRVVGRINDVIKLRNNKVVTALYLIFDDLPEIKLGQIIQNTLDSLDIRVIPSALWTVNSENKIKQVINNFLGENLNLTVEILSEDQMISSENQKYQVIISKL